MREPLPDDLPIAFAARQAPTFGLPRSRLRASDLERPVRGGYVRTADLVTADERDKFVLRARAVLATLSPTAFVSHESAGFVWDIPLPFGITAQTPIHVGVVHPHRPPRLTGVCAHRVQASHVRVVTHPATGLRIASPASTWAMLGSRLVHPYDVVAAAEAVITDRVFERAQPLATLEQLEAAAFAGRRVGINALRAALPRVRARVASRPETWMRLVIVDAGLPEPRINLDVFDESGEFIGCVDLAYPALKIAIEYEGEHHLRDPAQWARDILRYERLAAAGWTVIRLTKSALFTDPASIPARIRVARG